MITTLLALSITSMSATAAYICVGKVVGLSIDANDGHVLVEKLGPLVWPRLCSIKETMNNISPEACKVVYSTLMTAQISNRDITMWFNDGKDCSSTSHVPWQTLTGWYFGPKLH